MGVRYADWFTTDLPPTWEMEKWLDENKLTMVLKSLGATADIFVRLGFTDIELEDLAEHFGTIFHEDMAKLDTQVGESMQQGFGKNTFDQLKEVWFAPCPILARQGQLRIGNLYATKPPSKENLPRQSGHKRKQSATKAATRENSCHRRRSSDQESQYRIGCLYATK